MKVQDNVNEYGCAIKGVYGKQQIASNIYIRAVPIYMQYIPFLFLSRHDLIDLVTRATSGVSFSYKMSLIIF